jgi:hypothetical protein
LKPSSGAKLHDGRPIGLATVNSNLLWPVMLGQSLADKAFSSFQVAISAEHERECIAFAIDDTIQIKPFAFVYIGLTWIPFACDRMRKQQGSFGATTPLSLKQQFTALAAQMRPELRFAPTRNNFRNRTV